jgi:hypothetical protein
MKFLALIVVLAGCGVSSNGVCKKACTKSVSCAGGTTQQIDDCQMQCDTTPIDLTSCTNSGDILSCANDCLNQNCNDYVKCVGGCPKCVTNGQDLSMSSNNSDMSRRGDMATGSDWCSAFCANISGCQTGQCNASTCMAFFGTPNACQQTCIKNCAATENCNNVLSCIGTNCNNTQCP